MAKDGQMGARTLPLVSNGLMNDSPFALWSIWRMLFLSQRFVIFVLFGVSLYTIYVGIKIFLVTRQLKKSTEGTTKKVHIAALLKQCKNVGQMIATSFYLSGAVIFLSLRKGFDVLGLSSRPSSFYVAQNFMLVFAYGANVFLILFILHSIQWFLWRRLNSLEKCMIATA
jgi:hypothetical protein